MKNKFINLFILCLFSLTLVGASAQAATITIDSIEGVWENTDPTVSGEGTNEIRWGTPADDDDDPSGYRFDAVTTPFNVITDTEFKLGDFTHFNFPITGTTLETVDLKVDLTLGGVGDFTFIYNFMHDETPNTWDPYASRDIVTFVNNASQSDVFTIGDKEYTLYLSGFMVGGELVDQFKTWENCTNVASLFAVITSPTCVIPEPSTYLLLGSMLVFALVLKRKRVKATS